MQFSETDVRETKQSECLCVKLTPVSEPDISEAPTDPHSWSNIIGPKAAGHECAVVTDHYPPGGKYAALINSNIGML